MAAKPKTARAVRSNKGVEARYRKEMDALIQQMSHSTIYWLSAQYKKTPPLMADESRLASDELPSAAMTRRVKEIARRWQKKFNDMAEDIAKRFAMGAIKATDNSFQNALKDAGWAVDFKMTRVMRDAANAVIQENVALISSLPKQYYLEIEGIVMRGYGRGRDLEYIVKQLEERHGIVGRRAHTIARDQCNKLTAVTTRARREELGITEAIWRHSGGGKEPRQSHVAASGKRFKISEGCLIDGKKILPGEEINCRCTSESVLPF